MLHIAICDDSAEFLHLFYNMLTKLCAKVFCDKLEYEIADGFGSAEQVLSYIEENEIDVLFLDIDMTRMSGLELARRLISKNEKTVIVFVSGYDHYVYEVFEFSPFAFLRKNKLESELPRTLDRILEKFAGPDKSVKIVTPDAEVTVDADDVLYVYTDGNYYFCRMKNGTELKCRGTLTDAEKLFCKFDFFRVHSAYIVNLAHIKRIEKNDIYIDKDRDKIPVAQRRLSDFRQAYARYTMRSLQI